MGPVGVRDQHVGGTIRENGKGSESRTLESKRGGARAQELSIVVVRCLLFACWLEEVGGDKGRMWAWERKRVYITLSARVWTEISRSRDPETGPGVRREVFHLIGIQCVAVRPAQKGGVRRSS
jgi:hypothetical protein